MKDKITRKSKGVAFVLFLKKEDALACSKSLNGKEVSEKVNYISVFMNTSVVSSNKMIFIRCLVVN